MRFHFPAFSLILLSMLPKPTMEVCRRPALFNFRPQPLIRRRPFVVATPRRRAQIVLLSLQGACSGETAVGLCLRGACGQDFFCRNGTYCCPCRTGASFGRCVNSFCPVVSAVCNINYFCCPIT